MKKPRIFQLLGFVSALALSASIALANEPNRMESLAKLTKTIAIIEKYYVEDQKFNEIIDKAINGLLTNLDAHSSFLDEKAFKDIQVQTSGEFGGLGITVGIKDGALTVIAPIDDTPAYEAGIKAGDVILRIDGVGTIGTTIDDAVAKMRGKAGTKITLTIVRQGEKKPFDVTITRDTIKVQSVTAKKIDGEDILYLRVSNFDQHVTLNAKKLIEQNRNIKGIVLDLRNNPGGLLNQAVGLTNIFVKSGVIVSQKGRNKEDDEVFSAKAENFITDLPLSVLVNGGSASASEIVSGALQDLKRAAIVGENTFGKGSVQVVLPVDKTEALRLTVARYYLPSGRTIQAVGVKPDIVVHPGKVPGGEFAGIKEADLKQHLQSELNKLETKPADILLDTPKLAGQNDKKANITRAQVLEDIQLKTAIDAVKVLSLK